MAKFDKISAQQAREDSQNGALLINGYDERERWNETKVESAVSFPEFKQQIASLPKDKELIFYCDCDNDKTATGRAEELSSLGFNNVKVVNGGFKALSSGQTSTAGTASQMM